MYITYMIIISNKSSMKPEFRQRVKEGVLAWTSTAPKPDFGAPLPKQTSKSGITD